MGFTHIADEDTWNRLARELPHHGIYQAWSWGELRGGPRTAVRRYALLRGGRPRAAASIELRRMARLPWRIAYAPRGPLWMDDGDLEEFLARLSTDLLRSGVVHLKVNPSAPEAKSLLPGLGFLRIERPELTFGGILPSISARLSLPPRPQDLLGRLEADARRRVRQSRRRGIEVAREEGVAAVDELYPWLERNSLRLGFHLPPRELLRSLASAWLWRGEGSVLLARHEGECVGGAICSYFGDEATGHFIADDPGRRELSATYALYAAGLEEALARGCRYFDFGGVRAAAQEDPLLRFKRQFGAFPFHHAGEWNLPLRPEVYSGLALITRGAAARRI